MNCRPLADSRPVCTDRPILRLTQFRDVDIVVLERMGAALDELVAEANGGPCAVEAIRLSQTKPALMP